MLAGSQSTPECVNLYNRDAEIALSIQALKLQARLASSLNFISIRNHTQFATLRSALARPLLSNAPAGRELLRGLPLLSTTCRTYVCTSTPHLVIAPTEPWERLLHEHRACIPAQVQVLEYHGASLVQRQLLAACNVAYVGLLTFLTKTLLPALENAGPSAQPLVLPALRALGGIPEELREAVKRDPSLLASKRLVLGPNGVFEPACKYLDRANVVFARLIPDGRDLRFANFQALPAAYNDPQVRR